MVAKFPVLIRDLCNNVNVDCIGWYTMPNGMRAVVIRDAAALSSIYGKKQDVWLQQFRKYGFESHLKSGPNFCKNGVVQFQRSHSLFNDSLSDEDAKNMRQVVMSSMEVPVPASRIGEQLPQPEAKRRKLLTSVVSLGNQDGVQPWTPWQQLEQQQQEQQQQQQELQVWQSTQLQKNTSFDDLLSNIVNVQLQVQPAGLDDITLSPLSRHSDVGFFKVAAAVAANYDVDRMQQQQQEHIQMQMRKRAQAQAQAQAQQEQLNLAFPDTNSVFNDDWLNNY
jgi:hypothetical protein